MITLVLWTSVRATHHFVVETNIEIFCPIVPDLEIETLEGAVE